MIIFSIYLFYHHESNVSIVGDLMKIMKILQNIQGKQRNSSFLAGSADYLFYFFNEVFGLGNCNGVGKKLNELRSTLYITLFR